MFDKTVMNLGYRGPSYSHVQVDVKNAPTHESVKLLREMEQTSKSEVINSMRLDNNQMRAVFHRVNDMISGDAVVRTIFELNGIRHEVTSVTNMHMASPQDRLKQLVEDVSRKVSEEILQEAFKEAGNNFDAIFR
ncbi:hypothetical protein P10VF_009 [Rhizobium phage vB_RleM_P10VF]|uniref:Uncharacterized protein n=1 Tax=Rhizobium phage vB_RleM_P10VF TaxID=1527770 RepID=A0A076YKA6_9CAUD|nr:hypothetical protein P10VF_009 [Rhizobium phage vB_RleM_P10VF]AIK68222.1 hypothetical protein P10VF_009 [Rhizobium phage vB_RleM_P10VF]